MTDEQIAARMLSLKGEICTLSHQRELATIVRERGLMRFCEWPSGHWSITDKGRAFLVAQSEARNP